MNTNLVLVDRKYHEGFSREQEKKIEIALDRRGQSVEPKFNWFFSKSGSCLTERFLGTHLSVASLYHCSLCEKMHPVSAMICVVDKFSDRDGPVIEIDMSPGRKYSDRMAWCLNCFVSNRNLILSRIEPFEYRKDFVVHIPNVSSAETIYKFYDELLTEYLSTISEAAIRSTVF